MANFDELTGRAFLVLERRGGMSVAAVRVTKGRPQLDADQVAIAINLKVHKELFEPKPTAQTTIEVGPNAGVLHPVAVAQYDVEDEPDDGTDEDERRDAGL